MVIKRYTIGIAFVLLMMGAFFIAMAAAPDISISVNSPSNGSTINGTFVFSVQFTDSV